MITWCAINNNKIMIMLFTENKPFFLAMYGIVQGLK